MIVIARLIPHPPNFTPVLAVALSCGALYARPVHALTIPLLGMLAGDLLLGLHAGMWSVYLSLALCAGLGRWMMRPYHLYTAVKAGLSGSVLFFALTNFGVWLQDGLYPMTIAGLLACYIAAIPFFHHTLLSTLLFSVLLASGVHLARERLMMPGDWLPIRYH